MKKRSAAWLLAFGAGIASGAFASGTGSGANKAEYGLPTVVTRQAPVSVTTNDHGRVFVDFGKAAFGWLELVPPAGFTGGVYQVQLGEARHDDNTVDTWKGGTIRAWGSKVTALGADEKVHRVAMPPNARNTYYRGTPPAVMLPKEVGVVLPFRYAEFYAAPFGISPCTVRRAMVHYPLDMKESSFECSDPRLVEVYELCKYTILATTFAGLYVDGDRERIPYEADAYINQLSHYAVSSDYKLARATHEYLLRHPTWPTEWKQHSIMIAWADWMWTGCTKSLEKHYDILKNEKLLLDRAREDALLSSPLQTAIGNHIDIIDWPPRERDGYVFCRASAVINAFHYLNLRQMAEMAAAIGRREDAEWFAGRAQKVKESYRRLFRDGKDGLYFDGEGTAHKGLHANVAALAFGLAEEDERAVLADYIVSKGMKCSVYFAQYLLEALFIAGRDREAIALMSAGGKRSWLGMIEQGSTMTLEAWDLEAKPNLDWNHAWGTAPLNVITRYVLGVQPAECGYARIRVKPQTGNLKFVRGVVPTVKGPVTVEVRDGKLTVDSPVPVLGR
jgi:hypothetical protein